MAHGPEVRSPLRLLRDRQVAQGPADAPLVSVLAAGHRAVERRTALAMDPRHLCARAAHEAVLRGIHPRHEVTGILERHGHGHGCGSVASVVVGTGCCWCGGRLVIVPSPLLVLRPAAVPGREPRALWPSVRL